MEGYYSQAVPWPAQITRQTCTVCNHPNADHFHWVPYEYGKLNILGCSQCAGGNCVSTGDKRVPKWTPTKKETPQMSAVNLCDRCDSLSLGKAVATIRIWETPAADSETKEICPLCMADLVEFFDTGPVRDKTVSREPFDREAYKESRKAIEA